MPEKSFLEFCTDENACFALLFAADPAQTFELRKMAIYHEDAWRADPFDPRETQFCFYKALFNVAGENKEATLLCAYAAIELSEKMLKNLATALAKQFGCDAFFFVDRHKNALKIETAGIETYLGVFDFQHLNDYVCHIHGQNGVLTVKNRRVKSAIQFWEPFSGRSAVMIRSPHSGERTALTLMPQKLRKITENGNDYFAYYFKTEYARRQKEEREADEREKASNARWRGILEKYFDDPVLIQKFAEHKYKKLDPQTREKLKRAQEEFYRAEYAFFLENQKNA